MLWCSVQPIMVLAYFANICDITCSHEMQDRCNFCIETTYLPTENQVNNQAESNRIVGQFISHFGAQFKASQVELCVYLRHHADP